MLALNLKDQNVKFMPKNFKTLKLKISWILIHLKNSKSFVVEQYNTVQYRNSFFIKTVIDWNHLEEETVCALTVEGFRIALQHSD